MENVNEDKKSVAKDPEEVKEDSFVHASSTYQNRTLLLTHFFYWDPRINGILQRESTKTHLRRKGDELVVRGFMRILDWCINNPIRLNMWINSSPLCILVGTTNFLDPRILDISKALGLYDIKSLEAVVYFCNHLDASSPLQRETIVRYFQTVYKLAMNIGRKLASSVGLAIDLFKEWSSPCNHALFAIGYGLENGVNTDSTCKQGEVEAVVIATGIHTFGKANFQDLVILTGGQVKTEELVVLDGTSERRL